MKEKCDGICDVKERVECYKEWIQRYSNMVVILFTLRHTFREMNFKSFIEPKIEELGKPDLLVIDIENKEGAAIDHKIIQAGKKEHISKELEKVKKYIKDNVKIVVSRNQDPIEISIKDTTVIGPSEILDDTIGRLGYEQTPVPVITYSIKEAEVEIINKTKEIHTFNSTPMRKLFPRGIRRKIPFPDEAYSYKFILEEPPLCYLLFQVYNVMIGIRTNYKRKEIVISYSAVKDHINRILPRIFTTGGNEAEQLNESRLQRAWKKLKELQVIEDIGAGKMRVKQPQGSPLDYILRKLAKYEISKDHKCVEPQGLGLLKWVKPKKNP